MKTPFTRIQRTFVILFLTCTVSLRAQWAPIDPTSVVYSYVQAMSPSCISGSMIDTTCSYVTTLTYLDLNGLSATNIDGIRYFDNLQYFYCYNNNISSLPVLPNSLVYFDCSDNNISGISNLPNSITYLDCSYNPIVTMINLPTSLQVLYCSHSNLAAGLPALPSTLQMIDCSNALLTGLPVLPAGLQSLKAEYNSIDTLLPLPPALVHLMVAHNSLDYLPATLPSGLHTLDFGYNSVSIIPPIPSNLITLYFDFNTVTNFASLNLPQTNIALACSNNSLSCLPILPDSLYYFFMGGNSISCTPNYPSHVITSDIDPTGLPLCDPASGCPIGYNLAGMVYWDSNLDCNFQPGENQLSYIPVQLWQSGSLIAQTTNLNGVYSLDATLGNYDIIIDTTGIPFDASCIHPGVDSSVTLTALDSLVEDINFGFTCKPGYDVGISGVVRTIGLFFPGQNVGVQSILGDVATLYNGTICNTTGISGSVSITVSGPVTYLMPIAGSLTPTVAGSTFTYTIADFSTINPLTDFGLLFSTDTSANIGDQICFTVSITSSGTEYNTLNNTLNHCFTIINSYDPNVKEVNPIGDLIYPFNNWLTYTIHFQNTGNAPAINIKIKDVLDADLDESTFRLINASHIVHANLVGSNLEFLFNNIMLADSTTNEPESHGWVQYKIKPNSNLPVGTVINNTANIYFDFNAPITTNTTVNTIEMVGIESNTLQGVNIFPNPASDFIRIQMNSVSSDRYVQILDMLGRTVQQFPLTEMNHMISVENMTNGVYSVRIVEGTREAVVKIIVSK